jgi:hypothetical protein
MKTLLTVIVAVSILAIGTMAFAHGSGGWGGGHMMGSGYGGQMMGQGYGGHMRGWTGSGNAATQTDQKFLDETSALRKDIHNKRFEYFEAQRNPDTTVDTIATLEKEIYALQDQIHKNAPRTAYRGTGGFGYCN